MKEVTYIKYLGEDELDVVYPNGDKVKQAISITSLKEALSYAEQDLKDRLEFYKDRYNKKLKEK